jgi:DNA polymerase
MPDSLEQIAAEVRACQLCSLAKSRIRAVPGEGPADARIMLIGEGPGYHEDQQGRPFVGESGQYLEELLLSLF